MRCIHKNVIIIAYFNLLWCTSSIWCCKKIDLYWTACTKYFITALFCERWGACNHSTRQKVLSVVIFTCRNMQTNSISIAHLWWCFYTLTMQRIHVTFHAITIKSKVTTITITPVALFWKKLESIGKACKISSANKMIYSTFLIIALRSTAVVHLLWHFTFTWQAHTIIALTKLN